MPRGWPKGKKRSSPSRSIWNNAAVSAILADIVAASIARAHRNVEDDLPFTAGSDPDAILVALGLPKRSETTEPLFLTADLLESGPRRKTRQRKEKPAA